jgi:DNA (cytosine-5)-methyltransferase 1
MSNNTIRVFEAFAGYGSQSIALQRLANDFADFRFTVVGISEIDKHAIAAYRAIHGDHAPNFGDIMHIDWLQVPDFDLLTYSFPCQDISSAGRQRGFAQGSGTRSSCLWACADAISAKHPKWLLMENVKALTQRKFAKDFYKWREWLSDQGYTSYFQVLNAKEYGIPQNRERVFMVSCLGEHPRFFFPKTFPLEYRLKDILEDNVDESYYLKPQQVESIIRHCERKVAEGCGFKVNFQSPDDISGAIKTKEGQREYDTYIKEPLNTDMQGNSRTITAHYHKLGYTDNNFLVKDFRIRKLTPRECFRLMDVADSDIDKIQQAGISKTQQYKLAGNSIVVSCLYHVFRKMFIDHSNEQKGYVQLSLF